MLLTCVDKLSKESKLGLDSCTHARPRSAAPSSILSERWRVVRTPDLSWQGAVYKKFGQLWGFHEISIQGSIGMAYWSCDRTFALMLGIGVGHSSEMTPVSFASTRGTIRMQHSRTISGGKFKQALSNVSRIGSTPIS